MIVNGEVKADPRCSHCFKDFEPPIEMGWIVTVTMALSIVPQDQKSLTMLFCSAACRDAEIEGMVVALDGLINPPPDIQHIVLEPFPPPGDEGEL